MIDKKKSISVYCSDNLGINDQGQYVYLLLKYQHTYIIEHIYQTIDLPFIHWWIHFGRESCGR